MSEQKTASSNQPERPLPGPHAAAAGAYGQNAQKHTPDQRELEARVLLKSASQMQRLQENWDGMAREQLIEALNYNRNLWMVFVDAAMDDKSDRPRSLRSNIANLAAFIFNHTLRVLADPKKEKLDILISINREIAAGLMTTPKKE
jgi:flagellar protein FlaF